MWCAGWFTMIEQNLEVPFEAVVLDVTITVERVDVTETDQIVAICSRERHRQSILILDLLIPVPSPRGWEWIEAYRLWVT